MTYICPFSSITQRSGRYGRVSTLGGSCSSFLWSGCLGHLLLDRMEKLENRFNFFNIFGTPQFRKSKPLECAVDGRWYHEGATPLRLWRVIRVALEHLQALFQWGNVRSLESSEAELSSSTQSAAAGGESRRLGLSRAEPGHIVQFTCTYLSQYTYH